MYAMVLLPEWECHTCTEELQAKFNDRLLARCPRRPLLDRPTYFTELFWLYSNYSNGILPESGGLDDQPHKLMASIRTLIRARQDAESEKDDREKRRTAFRDKAAQVFKPTG